MNISEGEVLPPSSSAPEVNISGDADRLTVEYKNRSPIELTDLTKSLTSVAAEYRRFTIARGLVGTENARLYVQQIRSGSVIADLVPVLPAVLHATLPYMEDVKTTVEFANYLKDAYGKLLGKDEGGTPRLTKATLSDLSSILEPTAKDVGSQLNILAGGNIDIGAVYFNVPHTEANAIQNQIQRELKELKDPVTGLHQNVALYWYQACDAVVSAPGDRGVIESINKAPVRIKFSDETVKTQMLFENPFRMVYIVDVAVETVNERPVLYNVLAVHERMLRPDLEADEQGSML